MIRSYPPHLRERVAGLWNQAGHAMRLEPHRLVFIDETGTATKMTRLRGRCPKGDVVILDNLAAHKSLKAEAAIRHAVHGCCSCRPTAPISTRSRWLSTS